MPAFCSRRDTDAALDYARHLLSYIGEVNPYALDGRRLDLAGVVEIVRQHYGEEGARSVRLVIH
jgi:hypothetical protein